MRFTDRIRRALTQNRYEARVESYLEGSTSHADLERRLRDIDRGRFEEGKVTF